MTAPTFTYRQEILRKLVHLSSLWMPVFILWQGTRISIIIFTVLSIIVLAYEVLRRRDDTLAHFLNRVLGATLRPHEKMQGFCPSGALYVLLGALIATVIFEKHIAAAALGMILTGDVAAALVGRKWGRTKIGNKSVEGTVAFFATALACGYVFYAQAGLIVLASGAFTASIAELYSKHLRIDDNLIVPLAAGTIMTVLIA